VRSFRFAVLVGLWLGTGVLGHLYLWRRLVRDTGLRGRWRRGATVALILLATTMLSAAFVHRNLSAEVGRVLAWPAFLWLGVYFYSLLALGLVDVGRLSWRAVRWAARRVAKRGPGPGATRELDPARRQFLAQLTAGAASLAGVGPVILGARTALGPQSVTEIEIELARLPAGLDGLAIVQLTDLHAGLTIGASYVDDLVARANRVRADLVAFTGDLADGDPAEVAEVVAPLAGLVARHGVYYVTGNHEYYSGADGWLAAARDLGFHALRNQRVTIAEGQDALDLAGVDDFEAHRYGGDHGADLARATAGRDPARELVLLAHQPRQIRAAARHGVGLQLSGHTHGGQAWPWHYAARAQQDGYLAGYARLGATQMYISRGCGYWGPPVRIGASPEVARVILRAPGRAAAARASAATGGHGGARTPRRRTRRAPSGKSSPSTQTL
jgi:predicted MPP superfamily phosphohydrolase